MDDTENLINPLTQAGYEYGVRTDLARGIINNKDAALLCLAVNGGILKTREIKNLLRAWRPRAGFVEKRVDGKFVKKVADLHYSYLFNTYYGHISTIFDHDEWRGSMRHYSKVPYMWSRTRGEAAVSKQGYLRLVALFG